MIGTLLLFNPITVVPIYYVAYRVGALLLRISPGPFAFELSWTWLQHGLGAIWKPFLLGCTLCAVVTGILGWLVLELVWRWHVTAKYRTRHLASTAA